MEWKGVLLTVANQRKAAPDSHRLDWDSNIFQVNNTQSDLNKSHVGFTKSANCQPTW